MENKTVLVIMDFDGTLVDTETPDTGKQRWEEVTGNEWPHVGWWGRKESLDNEVFEQNPVPSVVADYNKLKGKDYNLMVMLTGRRPKLGNEVKAILDSNNLTFDKYLYNYGSDTLSNKLEQITNLLDEYKNVRYIKQYEDREKHIVEFNKFMIGLVDSGRIDGFDIVHVKI